MLQRYPPFHILQDFNIANIMNTYTIFYTLLTNTHISNCQKKTVKQVTLQVSQSFSFFLDQSLSLFFLFTVR